MNIKKLATEIRASAVDSSGPMSDEKVLVSEHLVYDLLDIIDNADDYRRPTIDHPPGTWLFLPDKQPTLGEAAKHMIDTWQQLPDGKSFSARMGELDTTIDNLKAALEREND